MPAVDVVTKLEGLAAKHKEKLNWKTSIVDLLKLLSIDVAAQDSAQEARRQWRQHSEGTSGLATIFLHFLFTLAV